MVARARTRTPSAVRSVEGTRTVVPRGLIERGRRSPGTVATGFVCAGVDTAVDVVGVVGVDADGAGDGSTVGAGSGDGVPPPPPLAVGVTAEDADDALDVPTAFVAVTVNV